MTQYKNINKEYLATLQILWENCKDLYKFSSNPGMELYRLQSFMYTFARQVVKVKELTDQYAEAQADKNITELKRIKYVSDRMRDEKAFVILWDEASKDYDAIVAAFKAEAEAETKVRTSAEILESCKAYHQKAVEAFADSIDIDL